MATNILGSSPFDLTSHVARSGSFRRWVSPYDREHVMACSGEDGISSRTDGVLPRISPSAILQEKTTDPYKPLQRSAPRPLDLGTVLEICSAHPDRAKALFGDDYEQRPIAFFKKKLKELANPKHAKA